MKKKLFQKNVKTAGKLSHSRDREAWWRGDKLIIIKN
jgi:hypothetical protein